MKYSSVRYIFQTVIPIISFIFLVRWSLSQDWTHSRYGAPCLTCGQFILLTYSFRLWIIYCNTKSSNALNPSKPPRKLISPLASGFSKYIILNLMNRHWFLCYLFINLVHGTTWAHVTLLSLLSSHSHLLPVIYDFSGFLSLTGSRRISFCKSTWLVWNHPRIPVSNLR